MEKQKEGYDSQSIPMGWFLNLNIFRENKMATKNGNIFLLAPYCVNILLERYLY